MALYQQWKNKYYLGTKLPKWLMDEGKYPGKVEVALSLQLKTESPANQVAIKVP